MKGTDFGHNSIWNTTHEIVKQHTLIIAPSGSGKTSLMGFMYGLRHDFSGIIELNANDISRQKLRWWSALRQQNISAIFQDLRLIAHLTLGENLVLKNDLTKFKTIEQIRSMTKALGIDAYWDQKCGTLSFGQQQRASIVRALLQPMDFLIADEPFSHLDDENIAKAKTLILEECAKQHAALILFSLGPAYGIDFNQKLSL